MNGDLKARIDPAGNPEPNKNIVYKYDTLGRLVARVNGTQWTRYTYDGNDAVLDEKSDGTVIYYGNGPGIDNKLWYIQGTTSPVFFLADHLGSARALVSHTGSIIAGTLIDYDFFGKPSISLPTRFQYAGREYDPDTQLYYYRARWYDPQARRFISEDPIGLSGGINLYAYVENDPINGVDPSGLGKLPANPSGLGPQWTFDPSHKDHNGSRWVNPDGEYLDFHKAQPGKPGWRGRDHWHHNGCDKHLQPGDEVPVDTEESSLLKSIGSWFNSLFESETYPVISDESGNLFYIDKNGKRVTVPPSVPGINGVVPIPVNPPFPFTLPVPAPVGPIFTPAF